MKKTGLIILLLFCLVLSGCNKQKELKPTPRFHLDTRFEVQVKVEGAKEVINRQSRNLDGAFDKIVELDGYLNKLSPLSEISALNSNAGLRMMELNKLTYDLVEKSLNASAFTNGYFDIAWYPLVKIFESTTPSAERIAKAQAASGYQNVSLDPGLRRVRYLNGATEVDFEHIKRGFAVDLICNALRGVTSGQIKAGDVTYYYGTRRLPIKAEDKQILNLKITDSAVAIVNANSPYYINSRVWRPYLPVPSAVEPIQQVIVIAPNATTAEVLANACYFMGVERSLAKIAEIKKQASRQSAYEVYFVLVEDDTLRVVASDDKTN